MMKIPYGKQYISDDDIQSVIDALKDDFLTQGPRVKQFENAFANYVGAKYAVAVTNATAALHLATLTLGVESGKKVITTPITFVASANSVIYSGGEVVFSDIDPNTLCLDVKKLRKILESSPNGTYSGVIPVDFAGYSVNMEEIRDLADEFGFWIIEDACHAPGASFLDKKSCKQLAGNGRYADISVFSFHPVKHIATGEGGMLTTNDDKLYELLLMYRTHGITKSPEKLEENHGGWYYEMQNLGYNCRLTDIQSALGLSQLQRAGEGIAKRRSIANRYNEAFKQSEIQICESNYDSGHAFHLYIIQIENRKGLYDFLFKNGIYAQVHYVPVHLMPYYKNLGWKKGDFPIAENYYDKCLSLPMYPTLTEHEQKFVIDKVLEFING